MKGRAGSSRRFATTSEPRWSPIFPMYGVSHMLHELPGSQLFMRSLHLQRLAVPALGWPNDCAVAEEYLVSAYLSCRVDTSLPRQLSHPYFTHVQLLGVLLAGIYVHNSSRKRGRDARTETPVNRFMTSFGGDLRVPLTRFPSGAQPRVGAVRSDGLARVPPPLGTGN